MAGNIVKWWKHKILGGYKQFSVQECTTDSEELVQTHQLRASSSCSAPPDLLMVSDRENSITYRAPGTNLTSITIANQEINRGGGSGGIGGGGGEYSEIFQQLNSTKDVTSKIKETTSNLNMKQKSRKLVNKTNELLLNLENMEDGKEMLSRQQRCSTPNEKPQQQQQQQQHQLGVYGKEKEEKIHFDEFTCDVSVEGGKSSKPLQFSFTFYDLDGHHGKITKDDIVGIVYTIYESIGKSVVVPHCGSKTINVRLTFSPESKSKTAAGGGEGANTKAQVINGHGHGHGRRQHRYRPRKLLESGDEEESNSEKEKENNDITYNSRKTKSSGSKQQKSSKSNSQNKRHEDYAEVPFIGNQQQQQQSVSESYYDSLPIENLKCYTKESHTIIEDCKGCKAPDNNEVKQSSSRVKVLRKTRKQKHQENFPEARQRSLSVGNEVSWRNRHLLYQQQQQQQQLHQQTTKQTQTLEKTEDTIEGVELRHPNRDHNLLRAQHKRSSAECWKTAFNRNDLISIIRESMEKNRLCFQLNEKPQANVTPIRQMQKRASLPQQGSRSRSSGVSKIPTLIANHNSISITTNNSFIGRPNAEPPNHHDQQSSTGGGNGGNNIYHNLQPHIPIYHQQMAINPAVVAAQNNIIGHSKINPCGYDSFLHATICGRNNNNHGFPSTKTPPPPPPPNLLPSQTNHLSPTLALNQFHQQQQTQQQHQQQQPVATVQPIISVPTLQNDTKILNPTSHQIKMSKILRSGSYTQNYQNFNNHLHHQPSNTSAGQQNSPQYRGYQRLPSSSSITNPHQITKHNLVSLNLQNSLNARNTANEKLTTKLHHPEREKSSSSNKMKPLKTYESLVYAKLREDLQESGLTAFANQNEKDNSEKYRRNKVDRRGYHCLKSQQLSSTSAALDPSSDKANYISMLNMNCGDAIECENLLGQTTDEETISEMNTPNEETAKLSILESEETLPTPTTATTATTSTTDALIDLNDDLELEEPNTPDDIVLENVNPDKDLEDDLDDDEDEEEEVEDGDDDLEDDDDDHTEIITGKNTSLHMSPSSSKSALISTTNNNNNSNGNNSTSTTTNTTSSLIHRCVHEHIHHHYHHFEKKDE